MLCENCGNQCRNDVRFCVYCGYDFEKNARHNLNNPDKTLSSNESIIETGAVSESKKIGKGVVALIVVTALIALVAVGMLVMNIFGNSENEKTPDKPSTSDNDSKKDKQNEKNKNDVEKNEKDDNIEDTDDSENYDKSDFDERIDNIKTLYYDCVDNLSSYTVETDGLVKTYYDNYGSLALIEVSMHEAGQLYYFDDGELYFAFCHSLRGEDRYYFDSGKLIRWIDYDNFTHDEEFTDNEYNEEMNYLLDYSQDLKNGEMIYRVRNISNDEASQISAFSVLQNAMNEADKYKESNYVVYDQYGNLIYRP